MEIMESQAKESTDMVDNDVIEIIPMDEYDSHRAKLKASLSWILHKAYKDSILHELQEPFYETADGNWHIKPHLVNQLASSEIYCQACGNMFSDTAMQWQGHWSIIQVLSRKGIYVTQSDETAVTETVLMKTAPFVIKAHLALIDALMLAYTSEVVTVERTVQAVRKIASFSASNELPSGVEDAVVFWVNKICLTAQLREQKSQQVIQGETNQKVRIVSRTSTRETTTTVPLIENLLKDIGDGCSLAVLISFYCPQLLNFTDICLKENVGIADSLYNLRLVKTFCEKHLPVKCFHFTYEDLLYTHDNMKQNILALLADIFFCFEVQKVECVVGLTADKESTQGSRPSSIRRSGAAIPQLPISNATKRSFQKSPSDAPHYGSNPELNNAVSPSSHVPPRQPLLHKRQQDRNEGVLEDGYGESAPAARRSQSLTSPQEQEVIRQSVLAWQEEGGAKHRQSTSIPAVSQSQESQGSTLLANVSIDSELYESFTDASLDIGDLEKSPSPQPTFHENGKSRGVIRQDVPSNLQDPTHPDYMEVESITSGMQSQQSNLNSGRSEKLEPLMPARLRSSKEKQSNHTKAQERGDYTPRKKAMSPTKPRRSRGSPVGNFHSVQGEITVEATVCIPGDMTHTTSSSSTDEIVVTPLPEDQLSARGLDGEVITESQKKGYEAFYINPDISVEVSLQSHSSLSPRATTSGSHSDDSEVAASYTIVEQMHTVESARAAGIPVVMNSNDIVPLRRTTSREGSVTSSRSSGDFSDHESHKIHHDHKARETADLKNSLYVTARTQQPPSSPIPEKPTMVITDALPSPSQTDRAKRPLTTNFAEIKRMKDSYGNVDNSGMVYMQHGQDQRGNGSGLKSAFLRKQTDSSKKTTFAALPNETTWQQRAQQASQSVPSDPQENGEDANPPLSSDLVQLRMKLDEKRKEIERKKHRMEIQQNKMRQRLGKAAFLRVVSRHMDDTPDGEVKISPHERTPTEIGERLGHSSASSPQDVQRPTTLIESPTSSSQRSRPFSREGIQQTIDNVKKRWFKDDLVGGSLRPPDTDQPLESAQEHPELRPHSQPMTDSTSSLPTSEDGATYEAYDSSLDKLNRSLTELQGEIARLSLQQEQIKNMQSPQGPAPLDPRLFPTGRETDTVPSGTAHTFPRTAVSQLEGYRAHEHASLPHGMHLGQGEPHLSVVQGQSKQPYQLHAAQTSQDQIVSSSVPGPFSQTALSGPGYIHPSELAPSTSQMYIQSPPQQQNVPYTSHFTPETLPYTSPIMSATQHHSLPQSVASYQAHSHTAVTYSVGAQPKSVINNILPSSSQMAQMYSDTHYQSSASSYVREDQRRVPTPPGYTPHPHSPEAQQSVTADETVKEELPQDDSKLAANGNEGFFVSFGSETPKRAKPELGKDRMKKEMKPEAVHPSAVVPSPDVGNGMRYDESTPNLLQGSPSLAVGSPNVTGDDSEHNISGTGFIISHSDSSFNTSAEDDMAKKKEKILQMQIKRKKELERKKMMKEVESAQEKERQRLKQEELEMKKAEEKAHREKIYQQYLQRKQQQEDEENGVVERPSKPKQRPKSMFVKTSKASQQNDEGLHGSQDDLSARALVSSGGLPFSCNTLSHNNGQGGVTYRRPPSPDLYRLQRRTPKSDSSDTGSNAGADYTGPKLFVKPSSKSNRHIMINAISHCCLAGCVNTDLKNKVLEEIARSDAKHFIILFRDGGCQYRALYTYAPEVEEVFKIHGVGPKQITNKMVEKFYKYNSGGKTFAIVSSTKHLSVSIDAVVLHNALWKAGRPSPVAKK